MQFLIETPSGKTLAVPYNGNSQDDLLVRAVRAAASSARGCYNSHKKGRNVFATANTRSLEGDAQTRQRILRNAYLTYLGRPLTEKSWRSLRCDSFSAARCLCASPSSRAAATPTLHLKLRILGGIDRQNRVGSKFGGGGVSSSAQTERERKERLKKLALESIDLAKDPYLIRNHLGSYECRLCLTLHRDEANYLAHTQGKKHQQGLAHRAHLEKLKQQKKGNGASVTTGDVAASSKAAPANRTKVKIGRPAYQVFKSRDPETNQRCLSFEVHYPEIETELQPRHRFMSAFEQRVESPPDRRYQYLLFAADPYETVAFKIPNEPIDKGENRFVTHWDADAKKFTVSLYFVEAAAKQS